MTTSKCETKYEVHDSKGKLVYKSNITTKPNLGKQLLIIWGPDYRVTRIKTYYKEIK